MCRIKDNAHYESIDKKKRENIIKYILYSNKTGYLLVNVVARENLVREKGV